MPQGKGRAQTSPPNNGAQQAQWPFAIHVRRPRARQIAEHGQRNITQASHDRRHSLHWRKEEGAQHLLAVRLSQMPPIPVVLNVGKEKTEYLIRDPLGDG